MPARGVRRTDTFDVCFTDEGGTLALGCGDGDLDGDQDIDCTDWDALVTVWTGPPANPPHSKRCDCTPFGIRSSDPPDGSIDARQDFSVTGLTRQGIDRIVVSFPCPALDALTLTDVAPESFDVEVSGGVTPTVLSVTALDKLGTVFEVLLSDPIPAGEWTSIVANVVGPDELECAPKRVTVG